MFGRTTPGMNPDRPRGSAGRKPELEGLEQRLLLYSTLGGQWAYGSRITYSIPPDGTNVAGAPNVFRQAMANRGITEAQARFAVQRAAAVWQSAANINLAEVADAGQALGISGNQQNDPRFGDIRIFAKPEAANVLGYAFLPPPFNGGTRAGDVVLNSSASWNVGANVDLQTVTLHELGHSLGLGHSAFSDAVMFDAYNGVKQNLTADDIAGLRALYGARQHDWVDRVQDNKDPWSAVNISGLIDANRRVTLANLDITSNQDEDWFYVQAPANASGEMVITMQSRDLSSLSPRFQVYNTALQLVGWTVAPNSGSTFGATISLRFTGVAPGTGVFIRAMGWNGTASGVNGIGAYALRADFSGGPTPTAIVTPPNTTVAQQPDQGGGFVHQVVASAGRAAPERPVHAPALPPAALAPPSRLEPFRAEWEALADLDPDYGTVAFATPGPSAMAHFARAAALAGVSPQWAQAFDAAPGRQDGGPTLPGPAARRLPWTLDPPDDGATPA